MEARVYFDRAEVLKALKEHKMEIGGEEDGFFYTSAGGCYVVGESSEPDLAYFKITEYLDLEIHPFLAELQFSKITLFDTLSKEENLHIKQGTGREGKTLWSITYGDKKFDAPTACTTSWAYAYKSVIRIRIKGTSLDSVKACYDKIRKGEMENIWKGEDTIPSHCGLGPFPIEESQE